MGLRLVFLGTPQFAVPTLAELIGRGYDIAAVYTQPARPQGRGLATELSPVGKLAAAHRLELRTPASLKGAEAHTGFATLGVDAAVVVAYGLLLPKATLDAPRLGCFNLHASLLPRWRGAAPIQRAIMAGDAETGVMAIRMEETLDSGPVLMTQRLAIGRKTWGELHDELARLGADIMIRMLSALERGSVGECPQGEFGITYAPRIANDETHIDWTRPARDVDCLIRALSPRPGGWCEARGERLKIHYAVPADGNGRPGEILDEQLTVACAEGALRLVRVQRAGRGVMEAAEFLRGFPLGKGERL